MSRYLRLNVRDAVKVGATTLPGVLTGLAVNGSLEIQQDKFEGSSTHLTSVEGFTTATVTLEITLLGTDQERERQLRSINSVFAVNPAAEANVKGTAGAWRVINPHLDARRIRQMLFTRFDSRDGSDDDSTLVSLEFREILQEQARLEKAAEQEQDSAATSPQSGELELPTGAGGPGAGATTPAQPPAPVNPIVNGLQSGFSAVAPPSAAPPPTLPEPRIGQAVLTP